MEGHCSGRQIPVNTVKIAGWRVLDTYLDAEHLFCLQARKNVEPLAVSHGELKQAVLRCQEWLKKRIRELELPIRDEKGCIEKGRPVALLMESDVGLIFHLVALLGLGVPPVLLSARLSPTAIKHLLVETKACVIIASPGLQSNAQEALDSFSGSPSPKLYSQNTYESFLTSAEIGLEESLASPEHYVADTDRNTLILHSSGTTGLPKPLFMTHRYTLCFTAAHDFPNDEEAQALVVSTLPLYHGFGLVAPWLSLGIGKTFCLPISGTVPSGSAIESLIRATKAKALMTVPSLLEDVFQIPNKRGISTLQPLQFVAFGGGPLKASVGDALEAAGVKLLNHYGATEVGPMAAFFSPPVEYNWRYFRLRKDMDLDLLPVETPVDEPQRFELTAHPFGWGTEFELQDQLFEDVNNPKVDFATLGRKDDVIVLATGEKVNPAILENMLTQSSAVKAALAFGENMFELGVITEPAWELPVGDEDDFKSAIWGIVVEAGEKMDAHARVSSRDAIIIARPNKPIPRSDKGSIMRREAYRVFEGEIAEVYRNLENSTMMDRSIPRLDLRNLEDGIMNLIQTQLNWKIPSGSWGPEDDVFELRMDSLQAVRLRRYLLASFPPDQIPRDFVYQHPTVSEMAAELRKSSFKTCTTNGVNGHASSTDKQRIEEYVRQFSLPKISMPQVKGAVVLLTGSTGSLGAHLLAHLVSLPTIEHIFCLNRHSNTTDNSSPSSGSLSRQQASFASKEISFPKEQWSKITLLEASTSSPSLGLPEDEYTRLRGKVTRILHNAWPVDFKRSLSSFKSQFSTLHNLLLLARDIHTHRPQVKPRFIFVSSIAVVGQYPRIKAVRIVPEVPVVEETEYTNSFGYGQAKLVCERILARVRDGEEEEGIEVSSVRVGQMSAASGTGYWNMGEHIPALVGSSVKIGNLPDVKGTLSWLPIDTTAQVLSNILLTPQPLSPIYHLENPIRQPWHELLTYLSRALNFNLNLNLPTTTATTATTATTTTPTPTPMTMIPLQEWIEKVNAADEDRNPAKSLVGFFRDEFQYMAGGEVVLDTCQARGVSESLSGSDVVCEEEDVRRFVRFWRRGVFG